MRERFEELHGIFYVPDFADLDNDAEDLYDYDTIVLVCNQYWERSEIIRRQFKTVDFLISYLIENLSGEFPETFIQERINFPIDEEADYADYGVV